MERKELTIEALDKMCATCFADLSGRVHAMNALLFALVESHPHADLLATYFARNHPTAREVLAKLDPPALPCFDQQVENMRLHIQGRPDSDIP